MSIHGSINISGSYVGEWYIQRLEGVNIDIPNNYTYTVAVNGGPAMAGFVFEPRTVHGFVKHDYRDGAIALLARVFADAESKLKESIDGVGTHV